jgi:hypothetical protein
MIQRAIDARSGIGRRLVCKGDFAMTGFWRNWFLIWCLSIGLFGALLAGGAFESTSGPVRMVLSLLRGPVQHEFDPTLRFSLAVIGAVSIGWAVTLYFIVRAAIAQGSSARPLWDAISAGMVSWFLIDSALSVATGFGLNVLPNVLLAGMYVMGLVGSGALKAGRPA